VHEYEHEYEHVYEYEHEHEDEWRGPGPRWLTIPQIAASSQ
jgi:hypothetical protein